MNVSLISSEFLFQRSYFNKGNRKAKKIKGTGQEAEVTIEQILTPYRLV